jgi:hypothetical protein
MKLKLLGAIALGCAAVAGGAPVAQATTNDAAAPYITKPGVSTHYSGNTAFFSAHVYCGDWKGIVQLQVGTQGVAVYRATKYICERASSTNVTFTLSGSRLPVRGKYEYTLKVGRHDRDGNVTRWTHSLHGFFNKY